MKSSRAVRIVISLGAIGLATAHLAWPDLSVDAITVVLFVVAIIPWLSPIFKSLEFPGGWKVEFRDLQTAKRKAQSAGLLTPKYPRGGPPTYLFQVIASEDPNLALAGVRLEIEKQLIHLAVTHDLEIPPGGISALTSMLARHAILTEVEAQALIEIVDILNPAVHGAQVEPWALSWAMELGPRIIQVLEERIPGFVENLERGI